MDKFKSFTGILLVTFTTITVVCNASNEVFINKESKCKTLSIDTDGTTIKWRKFTLNCKIELKKKDFWDDKICAKMSKVNLENYSSSVIFGTSFSILKKWTEYSSGDDFEVCTSSLFAYIELDLHEAYGAKFDLKVYSKKDDPVIFSSNAESEIDTAVHAAGMTVGIIVAVVIGLIIMVVVIIICICCCCMKGRRSQGHVYRQTPQTTTYQLTTQGQPQCSYPPQTTQQQQGGIDGYSVQHPPGFAGYSSQPGGYMAAQPQLGGYTATQPPQGGYTVHPPPAASAPLGFNQYQGYPPAQGPQQPSALPSAPPLENTSYPEKSAPPPPYPSVN